MGFLEEIFEKLRIPKIEDFKKVMVISPHPDDAEIAIGGTVAKLSDSGTEVVYVIATDGSLGTKDPDLPREALALRRKEEQVKAAEVLGVKEMIWLGFEDGGDYTHEKARSYLIDIIRNYKPQLVMTTDPTLRYEFHPDHIKIGKAASEAALFYQFPHFESPKPKAVEETIQAIGYFFTPKPNTFVCIDKFRDKKIEAIQKHESQMGGGMETLLWYLSRKEIFHGKNAGCEYAEAIRIMPTLALHAFAEGELI